MRTIWKYEIPVQGKAEIVMPVFSTVLTVEAKGDKIFLWAVVNTTNEEVVEKFRVVGTGHPIDLFQPYYLGTAHLENGLVFHVFHERP